eukprot:c20758_g1_i2.p1 GENE.c20758_g1_i2~~c20758_g1_i2.p1  ORF type:complete len:447 (+),score=190.17 c20758_g1_i2:28-1341(+)
MKTQFFLFYFVLNLLAGKSLAVLDNPTPPDEWIQFLSPDNQIYYHNPFRQISVWEKPTGKDFQSLVPEIGLDSSLMGTTREPRASIQKFFWKATESPQKNSITLSLQMDLSRLTKLEKQAENWKGPMNVAVILTSNTKPQLQKFVNEMSDKLKKNMNLHACFVDRRWRHYPINEMRNIAKADIETQWTFIVDADENVVFSHEVYLEELKKVSANYNIKKTVFPVTSWQYSKKADLSRYPSSKSALLDLKNSGVIELKAAHAPVAYSPPGVSLDKWFTLSTAQDVRFNDGYEPYYLALTGSIPDFDPRFRGWGGNKCIQTFQMAIDGYKYVLLPNVFTFVPDTPDQSKRHGPPPDPYLIERAWTELGEKRGCRSCTYWGCIQNCPFLIDRKSTSASASASSSSATSSETMASIMDTIEPMPIKSKKVEIKVEPKLNIK